MVRNFRIHPGIGVARVGNSEQEFMIAPERAGDFPTEMLANGVEEPVRSVRDRAGALKRCAARFRLFEYTDATSEGRPVEPGSVGIQAIEWTVHLANKKASWFEFRQLNGFDGYAPAHPKRNQRVVSDVARKRLVIDPGPRTVSGANKRAEFRRGTAEQYPEQFPPANLKPFNIDTLGELRTDRVGNLLVLGGLGRSGSRATNPLIRNYANNDDWFDDMSDGPVVAVVHLDDGSTVEVSGEKGAWVIVAPPDFAPQLTSIVTLYDTMYDVAVRELGSAPGMYRDGAFDPSYQASFWDDVAPILRRAEAVQWGQAAIPKFAHLFDYSTLSDVSPEARPHRERIFAVFRTPNAPNQESESTGRLLMPLLAGDDPLSNPPKRRFLTLTEVQYFLLKQWRDGKFVTRPAKSVSEAEQIDREVLQNCVGGAFCPGIEMTWIARYPSLYVKPFRIRQKKLLSTGLSLGEDFAAGLEPGDVTKRMALPWQADFNECAIQETVEGAEVAWWPAQRPITVFTEELAPADWTRGFAENTETSHDGDLQMVRNWCDLGVIVEKKIGGAPFFVEQERNFVKQERETDRIG